MYLIKHGIFFPETNIHPNSSVQLGPFWGAFSLASDRAESNVV